MLRITAELQADLVAGGVAQLPNAVGALPKVYDEPKDGAPSPRDVSATCTIALAYAMPMVQPWEVEAWLDLDAVDVFVRATTATECELVERAVRRRYVGRVEYQAGALHVNYSTLVAGNNLGPADGIHNRLVTLAFRSRIAALDAA